MEFQMNRESEILRNQKEFQRFRKKLFEVHLKPGKAIAKKFENYIDENEYETSSPEDIGPPWADGTAAVNALETNEATTDAEDVTTNADKTTAKDVEVVKDGDGELQHGVESTAWMADIVEDSAAAIGDYHRESVKEPAIAGYDDDDDEDDDDNYGDAHDDHAIIDENTHEEKKLDCESVSDDEYVGTCLRETPSLDYSLDTKDPLAVSRLIGTSELTIFEAFGVACVLGIWVDRIGLMDAMDGTGTLCDTDRHPTSTGTDDEESDDRTDTTSDRDKVTKFLRFVRDTLRLTVQELRSSGTYDELRLVNDTILSAVREERQLEAELAYNRNALSVLRVTIKERKKHYNWSAEYREISFINKIPMDVALLYSRLQTDKWRIQSDICNLDKQFKKTMKLIDLEADYIQSWENQCLNENDELLKEEANRLRQPIQLHDSTSIARNVIFPELITNIGLILEKWERMYDVQVSAIDVDTLTLESEEEQENDKIKNLQEIVDCMQITIDEFEERKRKYEERMRYEAHINKMATRIQAFWRGTRVRRFLGPYKYLRKLFRKISMKRNKPKKKKLKKK